MIIGFLLLSSNLEAKEKVTISSLETIKRVYNDYKITNVQIKNKSTKELNVSVIDTKTNEWVKGFGLAAFGKVIITVGEGQTLKLENTASKPIIVNLDANECKTRSTLSNTESYVSFILHNSSAKSIPLAIPGVMSPNLSPFSNSGVRLKIGQKVYYKKGGKKILLFTVDDSIKEGEKLDVYKLIKRLEKDI